MPTLVIDIETIGEDFDEMDDVTKSELTKNIQASPGTPEYDEAVDDIKNRLVFSPLTGEIVAIGVLDAEKNQGVVYFQAPGESLEEFSEDGVKYKPMSEKQMLESFWGGAARYDTFVTWNGRQFDIPYLIIRSAVHGVHITQDLMQNRYLSSQRYGAKHIDVFDQVRFYGALRQPGSLHMWCRALGIESPKEGDVAASDVGLAFRQGKYAEIAKYNARDIYATKEIYDQWKEFFLPR